MNDNLLALNSLKMRFARKILRSVFKQSFNATYQGEALLLKFEDVKKNISFSNEIIYQFIIENIFGAIPSARESTDFLNQLSIEIENRINGNLILNNYLSLLETFNSSLLCELSAKNLLNFEYFLMSNGLYCLSFKIRKLALLTYEKEACEDEISLLNSFAASIELDDNKTDNIVKLIKKNKPNLLKIESYFLKEKIQFYYSVTRGDTEYLRKYNKKYQSESDLNFANHIKGKTIAVVGPAFSNVKCGEEIDHFDIVIRVNYQGLENMPDPAIYGNRTNISYYNSNNAKELLKQRKEIRLNDLQFAVFKSEKHAKQVSGYVPSRATKSPEEFWIQGWPNMIQIALFDILSFEPSRVKLFKVNFYLSAELHHNKYITRHINIKDPKKLFSGHACHHIVHQLSFIKQLVKYRKLEVDEECAAVLKLSDYEYIQAMEDLYVNKLYLK